MSSINNYSFTRILNQDTFYRVIQQAEVLGLGISLSIIKDILVLYSIRIPTKGVDIVVLKARGLYGKDDNVYGVMLHTDSGLFPLEEFSLERLPDTTPTDFAEILLNNKGDGTLFLMGKDSFKAFCSSNILDIRVSVKNKDNERVQTWANNCMYNLPNFDEFPSRLTPLAYFRAAYNAFFDNDAYLDCKEAVQFKDILSEKEKKTKTTSNKSLWDRMKKLF